MSITKLLGHQICYLVNDVSDIMSNVDFRLSFRTPSLLTYNTISIFWVYWGRVWISHTNQPTILASLSFTQSGNHRTNQDFPVLWLLILKRSRGEFSLVKRRRIERRYFYHTYRYINASYEWPTLILGTTTEDQSMIRLSSIKADKD